MGRCPECKAYSDLKSNQAGCLVCPSCRAIFPDLKVPKKDITVTDLRDQVGYLQAAILEQGKTISKLMDHIKTNRESIQSIRSRQ